METKKRPMAFLQRFVLVGLLTGLVVSAFSVMAGVVASILIIGFGTLIFLAITLDFE